MKVIKFGINEDTYDIFKNICADEGVTVKHKISSLMETQTEFNGEINSYFPEIHGEGLRTITLKINEALFEGLNMNSDIMGIRTKKYVSYLIYKCVKER